MITSLITKKYMKILFHHIVVSGLKNLQKFPGFLVNSQTHCLCKNHTMADKRHHNRCYFCYVYLSIIIRILCGTELEGQLDSLYNNQQRQERERRAGTN